MTRAGPAAEIRRTRSGGARRHFAAAPWSKGLKATSAIGTVLVFGIGIGAYRAVPAPAGFTHQFGLAVTLVLPAVLACSLLLTVTGYAVAGDELRVERLLWSTRIPLRGLSRVWFDPAACKGSLRIVGNGGLFAYSGLFSSRRLGRYRLFATDLSHSVVLVLPARLVVVTPAAPQAFVEHLQRSFPDVVIGPPPGGSRPPADRRWCAGRGYASCCTGILTDVPRSS